MNAPKATSESNARLAPQASWKRFSRFTRLWNVTLLSLLIVSVTLNLLLARRIKQLTGAGNRAVLERQLKVGAQVPVIQAVDSAGQPQIIAFDQEERPTVLYVFTPLCKWCTRNMDNIKELVARKSGEFRFIGISLSKEGLTEYVAKNGLTVPVYTDLSDQTRKAYKMVGTPQTIVVSRDGKVIQNWMGAYTGEQQRQLEEYFGIKLPGVKSENQ